MSRPKPFVGFILSSPGSQKGTQCRKLVEKFGYKHLFAGDLLQQEQGTHGSQFGELADHHIRDETTVPVEITCRLLDLVTQSSGKSHFLIDGFPRNKDNLDGWNCKMLDRVSLRFVLFHKCPGEVCVERCLNRGQAGSGRIDNNIKSLRKRFKTYSNDMLPTVQYYDKVNLLKMADTSCNDTQRGL